MCSNKKYYAVCFAKKLKEITRVSLDESQVYSRDSMNERVSRFSKILSGEGGEKRLKIKVENRCFLWPAMETNILKSRFAASRVAASLDRAWALEAMGVNSSRVTVPWGLVTAAPWRERGLAHHPQVLLLPVVTATETQPSIAVFMLHLFSEIGLWTMFLSQMGNIF